MGKRAALIKIRQMTIAEKLAKLSVTDTAYVEECIDQAVQNGQSQQQECNNLLAQDKALRNTKKRKPVNK